VTEEGIPLEPTGANEKKTFAIEKVEGKKRFSGRSGSKASMM